uniref:Dicarboxylate/amino acid:cation (Na or H ) symporter (DAACS) family protein putative n=1 Tax=Albugo laibachii Nc14 TaxID=890382 RepID=F0W6J1_9STRA|nr:dicarboxylate/amino acid:cation (Na or H) symporter (DAACS) family protein putative [Albugo laibachii Nc14]CCA21839.1 dicarboxylate/amino acid:cation (Na or H) symporter (DAACS) family protein putative [Albugo laibachii Nc14]|eukprot:CCA21839.1 dicarboxylate/amino acid:cation (Na or H) symporter (DAACS) family protein putative [Albugo laibachii Nc14]
MPCFILDCDTTHEISRLPVALASVYAYHYIWDTFIITPLVHRMDRAHYLNKGTVDKMREAIWKNVAVGSLFMFGLYTAGRQSWFMNSDEYFTDWPKNVPDVVRWYYMFYFAYWLQSLDFLLNFTNRHYAVKRKDNAEMVLHHLTTLALMITSYAFDFITVGVCVLMLHDVSDLLLETAKLFVYTEKELLSNIFFGSFALSWYILRWGFYPYSFLYSAYGKGYESIVGKMEEGKIYHGGDMAFWYKMWLIFVSFLSILLVLHIYWGILIFQMVIRTLNAGVVQKDIRSDSEGEEEYIIEDKSQAPKSQPIESEGLRSRRKEKLENKI